jgi:GntR family transcriptional repressor for pyruvate dehydrogenase complex
MAKPGTGLDRIRRTPVAQLVAEQFIEMIHRENLQVGDKLPSEHELMKILKVGRSTVREALSALAFADICEVRHGQGYFVARSTLPAARTIERALRHGLTIELMEARLLIEVEMAGMAAQRADIDDRSAIQASLAACERAVHQGKSTVRLSERVHQCLLEAAHNEVLLGIVRAYRPLVLERGDELESEGTSRRLDEYEEHAALCRAVQGGDRGLARDLMREHLEMMGAMYMKGKLA